jgi:hypothetical protein
MVGRARLAMTAVRGWRLPEASSSKRSAGTVAVIAALVVFRGGLDLPRGARVANAAARCAASRVRVDRLHQPLAAAARPCGTRGEPQHGDRIPVTRTDGTQLTVDRPLVKGDSLIGRLEQTGAWPDHVSPHRHPAGRDPLRRREGGESPGDVAVGVLVTLTILAAIFRAAYQ